MHCNLINTKTTNLATDKLHLNGGSATHAFLFIFPMCLFAPQSKMTPALSDNLTTTTANEEWSRAPLNHPVVELTDAKTVVITKTRQFNQHCDFVACDANTGRAIQMMRRGGKMRDAGDGDGEEGGRARERGDDGGGVAVAIVVDGRRGVGALRECLRCWQSEYLSPSLRMQRDCALP